MNANRDANRMLAAAVFLSARIEVCEALLAGLPVPADRIDPYWVRRLGIEGEIVLTPELGLRVVAAGPMETGR